MNRLRRLAAVVGVVAGLFAWPTQAQAGPTQVAIVIAGDKTACVPWHSGMTGTEVLERVASVVLGQPGTPQAGMVLEIDGVGSSDTGADYWSYWHNGGSGWAYSSYGASSYTPLPGTVEGWRYISTDGSPVPPPLISYANICQDTATSSAPAPRTSSAPPPVTTQVPAPNSTPNRVTSAAPPRPQVGTSVTASATRTRATGPSSGHPSTPRSHAAVPYGRPSGVDSSTPGSVSASPVASPREDKDGSDPWPAVGTALGLVTAFAVGGVAYWRVRRQGGV